MTKSAQSRKAATADFRLALALAEKGPTKDRPDAEQVNTARHYLCYLCWEAEQYYDAVVLGDYLAQHAPDTAEGRQGAKIALAAYIRLYGDSKDTDKSFETEKIRQTAEYMLKHWPAEAEAEDAALALLNFAITDRRLDDALGYLNRIPADSPRRAQSDLYAGQALWAAYLKASQAPAEQRPPQAELDRFKTQARQVLQEGVERIKQVGEPNPTIVSALLSLAQIYLDMNEGQLAITTLEDPKLGPLTLVRDDNPIVNRPGFAIETYKVAVRAYIANHQVDKAKAVMDALDKAVVASGAPGAEEMLTAIYISLGRELQQQMERLRKHGSKAELEAVSDAFEAFMARIGDRKTGADVSSLNWVAENFYGLAIGLDDPAAAPSDRVKAYYQHAVDAYRQILDRAAKNPESAPDLDSLIVTRLRMAVSLRRLGKFDEALKLIVEVLKQRPKMLTAQVAGAETYAAQGEVDKNGYALAMKGGMPDGKGQNVIWGWAKLAVATQDKSEFEETFYLARLKLAEARFLFGLKWSSEDKRKKIFDQARNDLWVTFKFYPNLGGTETSAKYDLLLKRIQSQLNQPIDGLREFKQRDAAGGKDPDQKSGAAHQADQKRSRLLGLRDPLPADHGPSWSRFSVLTFC